jgi:hypothetical protein
MLVKNIFGILILLFNSIGLGYLIYCGALAVLGKNASPKKTEPDIFPSEKKSALIVQEDIIGDEDDLLKDMDLSDLDDLNLDDFK